MIDKCSICGEYLFYSYHTCKPRYYVWREDDGIEEIFNINTIHADNHAGAAIKYAEQDFEFPDNEKVYVCSLEDFDKLMNEDDGLNDEFELSPEGLEKLKKICKLYELESEIVRNFNAYERE
jgi:hypothetical protein